MCELKFFKFGQSVASPNVEKDEEMLDNLILVDAFWIKDGMKIRFIPHQIPQTLRVVFCFEHDDGQHIKEGVSFELKFVIPGTVYQQQEPFVITTSILKELKENNKLVKKNGKTCYYCEIENFSSDLINAKIK